MKKKVINMDSPCRYCSDSGYWCRGPCRDKAKYINWLNNERQIVIDINKNGIRRENTYAYDRRESKRNKRSRTVRSV